LVIGRDWYEITAWHLTDAGGCATCGRMIPGVFRGRHGDWGARRQAVRLRDFASRP
jgi:pyruvate formate lyase activating enzyme